MAFKSALLNGSSRLDQAAAGGPSAKAGWPRDDPEAVRRIQKALAQLVGPMPKSFLNGPGNEPDGVFGSETAGHVIAFQRRVFPSLPKEWDARVGRKTLEQMDEALVKGAPAPPVPPAPSPAFVCGPDVTVQVVAAWTKIQTNFALLTPQNKLRACKKLLIPLKKPEDSKDLSFPTNRGAETATAAVCRYRRLGHAAALSGVLVVASSSSGVRREDWRALRQPVVQTRRG